jgi:hypothetical protein
VAYCSAGSLEPAEDHLNLWKQGVWMDPDLNKYDVGCAPNPYPPPALQRPSATASWAVRQIVLSRLRNYYRRRLNDRFLGRFSFLTLRHCHVAWEVAVPLAAR